MYDVAIVGAGPAGSTAAKILSEKGFRTLLLEKSRFPRDKPCGGGLQMRVLHHFKYIEENNLINSYSYAIRLHCASMKHNIEFQDNKPLQAMILRKTFDKGLVDFATRSGVIFQSGQTVKDMTKEKETVRLVLSDGTTVESQMVIGADGTWSTIAKKIGIKQSCRNIGLCVYNEYPMRQETIQRFYGEQRKVHLFLQPIELVGYGWVFPKKTHVNVGIAEFRGAVKPQRGKKNLRDHFAVYLRLLKQHNLLPKNLPTTIVHGGVFPTCPVGKFTADNLLLCGDAAGLVNPLTGEGIYYAMRSGEIAAKTAIKALETNNKHTAFLKSYQHQWNQEFHLNFSLLSWVSKHWAKNIDKIIERVGGDRKFMEILCHAISSPRGIHKEKLKILYRLILAYFTNRIKY